VLVAEGGSDVGSEHAAITDAVRPINRADEIRMEDLSK
jgi:hypothetical protein